MSRAESTIAKAVALGLAVAAVAAPAAQAQQDLRSPDRQQPAVATQDLRSPDTRDVASVPPSPEQRGFRDLVSPDARDSARDIVPVPTPVAVAADDGGFEWGHAGIGGAIVGGVVALSLVAVGLHRRRHEPRPGTPAVI